MPNVLLLEEHNGEKTTLHVPRALYLPRERPTLVSVRGRTLWQKGVSVLADVTFSERRRARRCHSARAGAGELCRSSCSALGLRPMVESCHELRSQPFDQAAPAAAGATRPAPQQWMEPSR